MTCGLQEALREKEIERELKIELSEEQIAATLCHEIGHCVQEGIFGVYKEYADSYFAQEAFRSLCFWQPITVKYGFLNIINLLWFVFFPFALTLGAINLIRNLIIKNKFKKQQENPTFRMKDELNRMDNENSQTLFKDIDTQILNKAILNKRFSIAIMISEAYKKLYNTNFIKQI